MTRLPAADHPSNPRPWGFWTTLLWALLAMAVWQAAQLVVIIAIAAAWAAHNPDRIVSLADLVALSVDGWTFALATIVATPFGLAVCTLAVRLRGWRWTDYFALTRIRRQDVVVGLFFVIVFLVGAEILTYVSGRPSAHPFAVELYRSAKAEHALPWLALAVIVAAPVGEELLFRGFVFRGWMGSRLGVTGTILLTSAIWTMLHVQYDWFFLLQVFGLGLLFGWLRRLSGSTTLTIVLHMLVNLWAALFTAAAVEFAFV